MQPIDINAQITVEQAYLELLKQEYGLLNNLIREKDVKGKSTEHQLYVIDLKKRAAKVFIEMNRKGDYILRMKQQQGK